MTGGNEAVYNLGKADAYVAATEYLKRVQKLQDARAAAMELLLEDYTEAILAFQAVKVWAAENLSEVDTDLWEILMSIDTSAVVESD